MDRLKNYIKNYIVVSVIMTLFVVAGYTSINKSNVKDPHMSDACFCKVQYVLSNFSSNKCVSASPKMMFL